MKKCYYVDEKGQRYEEGVWEEKPCLFSSEDLVPILTVRLIEGKVWLLQHIVANCCYTPPKGEKVKEPVFNKRGKEIGYIEKGFYKESGPYRCIWIPVTKDMLHEEIEGDSE